MTASDMLELTEVLMLSHTPDQTTYEQAMSVFYESVASLDTASLFFMNGQVNEADRGLYAFVLGAGQTPLSGEGAPALEDIPFMLAQQMSANLKNSVRGHQNVDRLGMGAGRQIAASVHTLLGESVSNVSLPDISSLYTVGGAKKDAISRIFKVDPALTREVVRTAIENSYAAEVERAVWYDPTTWGTSTAAKREEDAFAEGLTMETLMQDPNIRSIMESRNATAN